MLKSVLPFLLCGCVLLVEGPAVGEDEPQIDCENAMTQRDMNVCAHKDYEEADAALNAQWVLTKEAAKDWDEGFKTLNMIARSEEALLASQRAWLKYRDTQCDVEELGVQGGSMAPMVYSSCMAEMTRERTEELKSLVENY